MPRKAFLLRIDPKVLEAVQQWAEDELRSLNGQIEYLLRQALVKRRKDLANQPVQDSPPPESGEKA